MKIPAPVLRVLAAFSLSVSSLAQTPLPPGEPLVAGEALAAFAWRLDPAQPGAAEFRVIEARGPGFTRAWQVNTKRDTSPMAAVELRAVNARAVSEGDVAMIRFFARATEISDETGGARVLLVVRSNGVDFNSSYEGDFPLTKDWQEFLVPLAFAKDFAKGDAAFMFRFGFKRQVVELGGLEVVYYGRSQPFASLPRTRFSYVGREADAPWRKAALERIERIRKADFSLQVRDAAGLPLAGATVRVEQRRAAFHFGSALQFARLVHDTPENLIYREKVLQLFNATSPENDLKWVTWVGDWGADFSPAQSLAGLRWIRKHDLHSRGHVLVWPGWKNLPQFVQDLRGTPREKEIPGIVTKHIREIAQATRGLLDEWDVLNEPFTNRDLMDLFGREIVADWFGTARAELPGVALYLNDFSNHDATTDADHVAHFEETARLLLEKKAPLDGLGLQAHFNGRPNAPENILAVLDRYRAKFNLPVRFTEFDVWTFDEELQADYTRDFFILAFSHPSVVGIQLWGFWEKAHWRPSAAMYRADWSEKPNAAVYKSLVLDQWRTRVAGKTDDAGKFSARGFHGDYLVAIEHAGKRVEKTFSLKPGSSQPTRVEISVR